MAAIGHVWLDFSDTIATVNRPKHDELKYAAHARLSNQPAGEQQRAMYDRLYEKHAHSNASVFVKEYGARPDFWTNLLNAERGLYTLTDPTIPEVLLQVAKLTKLSIFSNIDTAKILPTLGIDSTLFTYILSSSHLQNPKPHIEGYQKIIELSQLPPEQILYIGDIEAKDVLPAKSVGLQTGIIWNRSNQADYEFNDFQEILNLLKSSIKES